jgi:hypothetical protein
MHNVPAAAVIGRAEKILAAPAQRGRSERR